MTSLYQGRPGFMMVEDVADVLFAALRSMNYTEDLKKVVNRTKYK
jgi:hypothetical protein